MPFIRRDRTESRSPQFDITTKAGSSSAAVVVAADGKAWGELAKVIAKAL